MTSLGPCPNSTYHLPNIFLVYQTDEMTRLPRPGNNPDYSPAKWADPLKPLSPSVWPSQQTTGPRCDLVDRQDWCVKTSKLHNLSPQTKGIDRLKHIADITQSYRVCNSDVLMARNNSPRRWAADDLVVHVAFCNTRKLSNKTRDMQQFVDISKNFLQEARNAVVLT